MGDKDLEGPHLHLNLLENVESKHQEVRGLPHGNLLGCIVCIYRRAQLNIPIRLMNGNYLIENILHDSVSPFRKTFGLGIVQSRLPVLDTVLVYEVADHFIQEVSSSITYQSQGSAKSHHYPMEDKLHSDPGVIFPGHFCFHPSRGVIRRQDDVPALFVGADRGYWPNEINSPFFKWC